MKNNTLDCLRASASTTKYIDNHIVVHCQKGTVCGKIENNDDIFLTDEQAIWIEGDDIQLIK